jgi:hypothetical protein
VPAAAVIPAPIVYIKVAAVKKLVVGFRNAFASKLVLVAWLDWCFLASDWPAMVSDHLL